MKNNRIHKKGTRIWLLLIMLNCCYISWSHAQIVVDFQNPMVTPTQICFDVYLSAGPTYATDILSGGEWTSMGITINLDLATVVPAPPTTTLSGTPIFSSINLGIIDMTILPGTNPPGAPAAPYDLEYRLTLGNATQKALPAVPTLAFNVCIPVLNGTVTADGTSDIQLRTNTGGTGSGWANNVPGSRPLAPTAAGNMDPLQDPLPIELLTFESRTSRCDSYLYWENKQTATNFDAQKHTKLEDFSNIANGTLYQANIMTLFPNPTASQPLNIQIHSDQASQKGKLLVLDVLGKIIQTQTLALEAGENKVQLPTQHLPNGTYFIYLAGTTELIQPQKFVKTNF